MSSFTRSWRGSEGQGPQDDLRQAIQRIAGRSGGLFVLKTREVVDDLDGGKGHRC
jgi:hypothetical protein